MRKLTPYLLLVPALLFTLFVLVYPLVQNLINSVSDVSMITGNSGWVGLHNYQHVFEDALFWRSFRNTAVYAVAGTLLALLIGLSFALLLNLKLGKFSSVMGCLYTVAWVISPVVAGFAWKWLLNDNFGMVNYWLSNAGIVAVGTTWLGDPGTALLSVIVARVWQFYPFAMPLRELLAAYAHNAWAEWMQYLFSKSTPIQNGCAVIPTPLVELWSYQMNIPYSFLPDSEQQAYLAQADQILEIFGV